MQLVLLTEIKLNYFPQESLVIHYLLCLAKADMLHTGAI